MLVEPKKKELVKKTFHQFGAGLINP